MPASEQKRLALRNRLIEVLGEEEAEVLMESLPPFDWHKLATKEDLSVLEGKIEANKAAIEASEERLRTEMDAGFANIRTEMDGKFANIRTEMDGKFAKVDAEFTKLRGDMALQFARQTRTMVFTMLGMSLPTWGAILAVGLG
ncbi:MAG: hypothetical protein OXG30_04145 [bacterium]|nr:hypothetical protein [bacterium]MCY4134089.1 hypothetical protein [bacterium]